MSDKYVYGRLVANYRLHGLGFIIGHIPFRRIMERLVIKYTVSDNCTYSCNVVLPIRYSSKQEAKLDFGSTLLKYQQDLEDHKKAYDHWHARYASTSNADKKSALLKEMPRQNIVHWFEFGGQTFNFSDFFLHTADLEKGARYEINEPEFLTVDEWFNE